MQHCTDNILSICDQIFNPEFCNKLAREHHFVQRSSSKIQGHEFIKTLILPSRGLSEDSLDGLCLRLKSFNPEVDISAPALAQRINNSRTVSLMKACFQEILEITRNRFIKQSSHLGSCLNYFNNVYMQDSTVFEVDKKLSRFFKGTKRGGPKGKLSCKAQVKIDLIHNFTTGFVTEARIYEGKRPDQSLTGKILRILKKNDLVLRDLGYFKIEILKLISNTNAFFLTRFPSHLKVFLKKDDKEPINLACHLNERYKHKGTINLNVWIGAERLPVRLVAYRMPDYVRNERLRKAKKSAKEMGRTLSKAKLDLLQFSIFITNIPEEWVPSEVIGTVYRLRWEIELIFKQWKSLLKIDVIRGVNRYRIEALIWGRLCTVILISTITAGFMNFASKYCKGELSVTKVIEYLIRNGKLCEAIKFNTLKSLDEEMIHDIRRRLLKNKRARKTMLEKVIDLEAYYEGCINF